jgi:hypothetical protein
MALRAPSASDRERERLRILLKVSQLLSSPAPLDEVLSSMLALAFEILDVDRGAVLMVDPETGELEARAVRMRPGIAPHDAPCAASRAGSSTAALPRSPTLPPIPGWPRQGASSPRHHIHDGSAAQGGRARTAPLYVDNPSHAAKSAKKTRFLGLRARHRDGTRDAESACGRGVDTPGALLPGWAAHHHEAGWPGLAIIETRRPRCPDISGYRDVVEDAPGRSFSSLNEYFPVMAGISLARGTLERTSGCPARGLGAPSHEDDPVRRPCRHRHAARSAS